jgi:hypothetical protein
LLNAARATLEKLGDRDHIRSRLDDFNQLHADMPGPCFIVSCIRLFPKIAKRPVTPCNPFVFPYNRMFWEPPNGVYRGRFRAETRK